MREPALIHCKSGADRAGLAAAIYLLAHGATVAQAAGQLSLRHGHIAGAEAGILGAFLQAYARDGEGRLPFRDWVATAYDPAALRNAHNGNAALRFLASRVLRRE
jgi:protein tyrosine/serine phosphatase